MNDFVVALETLKVSDFQARWEIAKQAEGWSAAAVPLVVKLLEEPTTDDELQWFLAKMLGLFQQPEAILALARLLGHAKDEAVCLMAAQMLARFGVSAIDPLKELMVQPDHRLVAIRALAQIEHPAVVPLLLEVVQDETAELRALALEALDKFQSPTIFPALQQGLQDPSPQVRQTAIAGLAVRGTEYPVDLMVEQLIPLLDDGSLAVAQQTAQALGRLAADKGAIALTEKCCAPDTPVILQQILIQSLGWINSKIAFQGLTQIWTGLDLRLASTERLMQDILTSIARFSEPAVKLSATQWLLSLLQLPTLTYSAAIRARIVLALGRVANPSVLMALIDLLKDPDYGVRLHIVAALKQLDPGQAHQVMQELVLADNTAPEVAAGLAIALQEW